MQKKRNLKNNYLNIPDLAADLIKDLVAEPEIFGQ